MKEIKMSEKRLSVPTNPARALRELNRQAPDTRGIRHGRGERRSGKIYYYTTNRQTYKPDQHNKQADKPTGKLASKPAGCTAPVAPAAPEPSAPQRRVDGRTLRSRQETADRTMVTSLRLAVSTVEALDEHCWRHRQRKQDVVQAALDMYFAAMTEEE